MATQSRFRGTIQAVTCALVLALCGPSLSNAGEPVQFDIASQPLSAALKSFAAQAKMQLLYRQDVVEGATGNAVVGNYDKRQALQQLIKGTGLEIVFSTDNAATIRTKTDVSTNLRDAADESELMRLAQTSQSQSEMMQENKNTDLPSLAGESDKLQEIVVTGSHIRGVQNSASPVLRFDSEDIERAGYSTLEQFVESLPQNFGGGASPDTVGTDSAVGNNSYGSGVNLRALGPGASLVLVNGRRLAPGGNSGRFVDVSMIPLSAVERIEVLTDGASAIYGSDAVGGVVNIILKKDYEGAQTALRYGSVTDGDLREVHLSQSLGGNWEGGATLLSYEYNRRDALDARDRDFAAASGLPRTLMPEQSRHSVYASAHQALGDRWSLFGDALYSQRDISNLLTYLGRRNEENADSDQVFGSVGADLRISNNWKAQFSTSYSKYRFDATFLRTTLATGVGVLTTSNVDTDVWSFDALTDGTLMTLPGGEVRMALGASHRRENVLPIGAIVIPERRVDAVFSEIFIPLFGPLELTLAARYEQYSDFGEDVTPKIGLRWEPVAGVSLRGTYGESFKAPTVTELAPGTESLLAFIASDFGITIPGDPLILLRTQAARPQLHEEESRSWTVGIDFQPRDSALSVGLTYFNIEFEGRIDNPIAGGFESFFGSPEVFGDFMTFGPDAAFVNARLADATVFTDLTGGAFAPNAVGIWADVAVTNIAADRQSGIDAVLEYPLHTAWGDLGLSLNATYITRFEKKVAPSSPVRDVLNLLNEPIDLKLRAGLTWSQRNLSGALFANHQDDHRNSDPAATSISSWTTFDAQLRYDLGADSAQGLLAGTQFILSIQNLLDKDPPFVASQGSPIAHAGYDSVNATPLGRFIALQINKSW